MADFESARRVGRIGELGRLPSPRLEIWRTRRNVSDAVFAMASKCCTSDKAGLQRLDANAIMTFSRVQATRTFKKSRE
jgi:hypothetical protein